MPDRGHGRTSVIGVGKASAFPPSELYGRFSGIQLSSRWFLHRDWLAKAWAS